MDDWLRAGRATSDIALLTDACTAVPGCEEWADTFEKDMRAAGVSCIPSTEVKF